MAIRIITDSSGDITPELAAQTGITVIPLPVTFGDTTYDTMDTTLFYEMLMTGEEFPKTSQPSPQTFCDIFEEAKESGDAVIAILLSSALSGTYQCACLAKNMTDYSEIYLIDSLSATIVLKILAEKAVQLRDKGCSALDIAAALEELKGRIKIHAVIDTLQYLYKGGRLSKGEAQIGTLANLKPVITVSPEGTVKVTDKCIGHAMASKAILKKIKQGSLDPDYPLYPVYTYDQSNCLSFCQKIQAQNPELTLEQPAPIGPVIGTHVGPHAFGVILVTRPEE